MSNDYSYIAYFLLFLIAFIAIVIILPILLRGSGIVPNKPNTVKNSNFECGMETIGETWVQINFHYYFYALIFLTLDIMVAFLYPWATELKKLGSPALISILVFIFIIAIGYIYAWKNKALEWE